MDADNEKPLAKLALSQIGPAGLARDGGRLLAPISAGLARGDCQEAASAISDARRELPSLGDLALQEVLSLQLRYLAWEVDLLCAQPAQLRGLTIEALLELARPQYTPEGRAAQSRLRLRLCIAAHQRRLRHLSPSELHMLLAGIAQDELDPPLLAELEDFATASGDAAIGQIIANLRQSSEN